MPTQSWPFVAQDGEELPHQDAGQDWIVSWHPPPRPPQGTPHGAAGVCVTDDGMVVLVELDGRWEIPAGRTEGDETWEETLRREMMEEACAVVVAARLLGFARSRCVRGVQEGHVIVRSMWRAEVELRPWEPLFEIPEWLVVPAAEMRDRLAYPKSASMARITARMLHEADIPQGRCGKDSQGV